MYNFSLLAINRKHVGRCEGAYYAQSDGKVSQRDGGARSKCCLFIRLSEFVMDVEKGVDCLVFFLVSELGLVKSNVIFERHFWEEWLDEQRS